MLRAEATTRRLAAVAIAKMGDEKDEGLGRSRLTGGELSVCDTLLGVYPQGSPLEPSAPGAAQAPPHVQ